LTESYDGRKDDYFRKVTYLSDKDVTVETFYRVDFTGERSCGYVQVLSGDSVEDEEAFELYKELIECGLPVEKLNELHEKIISEIESGKLDVTF